MAGKRLGVLVSGSGSNLAAILDACAAGKINGETVVVLSSKKDAYALTRAERAGVPGFWVDKEKFPTPESYNEEMLRLLLEYRVELVVMAGYMRLLGREVLEAFPHTVINLHPSLLPSFPGGNAIEEALAYGVKVTGITVHFADSTYDTGPIILQELVPVHQHDTLDALAGRIHKAEHSLLPRAISLWADDRLRVEGRRVYIQGKAETGNRGTGETV